MGRGDNTETKKSDGHKKGKEAKRMGVPKRKIRQQVLEIPVRTKTSDGGEGGLGMGDACTNGKQQSTVK